jgi:GntR family transcriptional repressor for pyruvate dehydrogenase complex
MTAGCQEGLSMQKNPDIFTQISNPRKSQIIEDQIKASISAGHFHVKERLPPERELAELFGTSRSIVREAIRSLEKVGLLKVKIGVQGGAFVTNVDKKPLLESIRNMILTHQVSHEEIAEARLIIEPSLAIEAAKKATPKDLERLRESNIALKKGFQSNDVYVEHNPDPNLHKVIAEITGNRMLSILMEVLMEISTKRFSSIKLNEEAQGKIAKEHEGIVASIENKDPAKASKLMQEHILTVYHSQKKLEKKPGR